MIIVNGKQYSGNVVKGDGDILTIVVHSIETIRDVADSFHGAREITEKNGDQEKVYTVTAIRSAKHVSTNVFLLEFHTKAGFKEEMEAKLKEANDAIDALLVALLGE